MAAKTTAGSGDWATGATWTGGVKPGSGDTATINHAVTVSTSEIVGNSPASDTVGTVLTINAALTIQNGGVLKMRGPGVIGDVNLTINGGGQFTIDASQATSPSTRHYRLTIGTAHNQTNNFLVCNASSHANPGIFDSDSGGGNGYTDSGSFSRGGRFQLAYCNVSRIGTDTLYAFSTTDNDAGVCFADNCIFDGCAGIANAFFGGTTGFRLLGSTWKNSTALQHQFGTTDALTTGTRSVTFCVFDKQVLFYAARAFTIEDNIFYLAYDVTNVWASNARNLIRTVGGDIPVVADILDAYILFDADVVNPHFLGLGEATRLTLDGLIFELAGTDSTGDCIPLPAPAAAMAVAVRRCIVLPNDAGGSAGSMTQAGAGANMTFSVEHCTYQGRGLGVYVGEGYAGHAGMLSSLRGNIAWGSGLGYKIFNDSEGAGTNDIVSAANADYNCGSGLQAGVELKGYDTPMTGTPGAHDVDEDPSFVDSSRNSKTWDTSLGGAGTRANALTELMKRNERSGYNTAYSVPALLAHVRQGFAPQNRNIRTASFDGKTMGAVQVIDLAPDYSVFPKELISQAAA